MTDDPTTIEITDWDKLVPWKEHAMGLRFVDLTEPRLYRKGSKFSVFIEATAMRTEILPTAQGDFRSSFVPVPTQRHELLLRPPTGAEWLSALGSVRWEPYADGVYFARVDPPRAFLLSMKGPHGERRVSVRALIEDPDRMGNSSDRELVFYLDGIREVR